VNVSALTVIPSATGISIDLDQVLTGAAISTAGTLYGASDVLFDSFGDQFNPTVGGGGAITGLTVIARGHTVSPPGAPVTLNGGRSTGATATLTFGAVPLKIYPSGRSNIIMGTGAALATNAVTGLTLFPTT